MDTAPSEQQAPSPKLAWIKRGVFALLTLLPSIAIFAPRWLPLQDWPQHLAAIRVLHDYHVQSLGFEAWFNLTPLSTQYIGFYYVAKLFAYIVDVDTAARLVLSLSTIALPYATANLLKRLNADPWLAVATIPLAFNTFFLLGFANFLAALPLMVLGLSLAIQVQDEPTTKNIAKLSITGFLCFLMHVVPFALFFGGALAIFITRRGEPLRAKLKHTAALVPPLLLAASWAKFTDAGGSTMSIAKSVWLKHIKGQAPPQAYFMSPQDANKQLSSWLLDVVQAPAEAQLVHLYLALIGALILYSIGRSVITRRLPSRLYATLSLLALSAFSIAMYYLMPTGYDWVWPIAPRFPLLALILLIGALKLPQHRVAKPLIIGAFAALSMVHTWVIYDSFQRFNREEVADFEQASASIPEGSKVAGLIFSSTSKHIRFAPFLHSAALHQSKRGGAVMFTFADFPQSPFRFKEDNRPPRVPPRWEWSPAKVVPSQSLQWYDYIITRGGPGRVAQERAHYTAVYNGERWSVWQRRP